MSLKFPLLVDLFDGRGAVYAAYTNQSYSQAYADSVSSPFRDINHEPEIFLSYLKDWELFGWKNTLLFAGFVHQSNGRALPLSRSWNRLYANAVFERGNWAFSVKPWYRIPEDERTDPSDPSGDDNPDIEDYLGYTEFRLAYADHGHVVALMSQNNLTSDGKGALELSYSFPLYGRLKGYLQYFNGYGQSLIDYNARSNSFGIGVAISDWLE